MENDVLCDERILELEEKVKKLQEKLDAVPFDAIRTRLRFKTPMAWMTPDEVDKYYRSDDAIVRWLMSIGRHRSVENSGEKA